jgi:molybdopterin-biosynthesis enzyme MoeA-like protein
MTQPPSLPPSVKPDPRFGLIIVGDEILSGKRTDKHLPKVIELLKARGLQLDYAEYVQCAAKAQGLALALHPEAEILIRQRMQETAREQGTVYEADRPDNIHRLNMGVFPVGAQIIPNPFNKIPGFTCGTVHFVPGFPVMAWPMMEWVLDTCYPHLHQLSTWIEQSVIVFGAMEATLTPLMEDIERDFAGIKVFSLPSVDHPQYGRHIELGVKGEPELVSRAYGALLSGLKGFEARLGPELVQK